MNFGGLPWKYTKPENSEIVVLQVPYDETSTWIKGADKGPQAILEASANMELFDIDTQSEVYKKGIYTDLPILEKKSPLGMVRAVKSRVTELLHKKKFVVTMGGEHSVSIGSIFAAADCFENLTIVQLDAHADLRQEYEGSKYNHACVMARAREVAPVVQLGIRSISEDEEVSDPARMIYAREIVQSVSWKEKVWPLLTENVYLTIDLDVFDPAYMPSTGTPEPGGLDWYQVSGFVKELNKRANIIGIDIVELCPNENNKAPDFLAAKLIYQILSYKFFDGSK